MRVVIVGAGVVGMTTAWRLAQDGHQVTVLEEGYAWQGQTYASLSAVARAITQTNWNGFVFFGLRQAASREVDNG